MTSPTRGFEIKEFRARVRRAQTAMASANLAALLLTTEPEVRYFSGFLTRFWESPTRPWFLIVPASGDPIAVIPSIGSPLMGRTWIKDIRTWRAPDMDDDGISLLGDTLREVVGASGRVGLPMGIESYLRMPQSDFHVLAENLGPIKLCDDAGIMRMLRLVKSKAEIAKISKACAIGDRAFSRVHEIAQEGVPLENVFRRFQMLCLEEGADWVPYLAGACGVGGYDDVISPATDQPLAKGGVLMLDTGLVWDGYFCDFDRNFLISRGDPVVEDGYSQLIDAVDAAMQIAQPGTPVTALFGAMDNIVNSGSGGSEAGRLGHGLGMQLTEGFSIISNDQAVLSEGMVLTLEPGITLSTGRTLVHEEDIVITSKGAEFLSTPARTPIPVLGAAR